MARSMISQNQIAQSDEYNDDEGTEEPKESGRNLDGTEEKPSDGKR